MCWECEIGVLGCQPSNFVCLHTEGIIADLNNAHFTLARARREPSFTWPNEHAACVHVWDKRGCTVTARCRNDNAFARALAYMCVPGERQRENVSF